MKKSLLSGAIAFILMAIPFLFSALEAEGTKTCLKPLKGKYLGQTPPGTTPELFAPGLVSRGMTERIGIFTPNGTEFYYDILIPGRRWVIACMKKENGVWTKPKVASFSGVFRDIEPFISPDGKRLYFASHRPFDGSDKPTNNMDIWYMERTATGWSKPKHFDAPFNTKSEEFYPSITKEGTIYFTATYKDSLGGPDIYRSRLIDGKYGKPENCGPNVNTKFAEYNSMIAADESFLIWTSAKPGGFGGGDLYISFKQEDGTLGKAVNMGKAINSEYHDYCPSLTPNGKYFFFTSSRLQAKDSTKRVTYKDILKVFDHPQNGLDDIYWIDASVLKELKK